MPSRPVLGGEENTDYPNSNNGYIFSTEDGRTNSGIGTKFSNNIKASSFTKFLVFYLSHRTTSSFWGGSSSLAGQQYYYNTPGAYNTIISGHAVLDIDYMAGTVTTNSSSFIQFVPSASIINNYATSYNNSSGNEVIRIIPDQFDYSAGAPPQHEQYLDCVIPQAQRPQPNIKSILSVSVDNNTGKTRVRINGVQAFITGSGILKDKTFSFDYIGNESHEYKFINQNQNWSWTNALGFDGVIYEASMADNYMTDTDVYAMEQVIATRNGLSI